MNAPRVAPRLAPGVTADLVLHVITWDEGAFFPEPAPPQLIMAAVADGLRPLGLGWLDGERTARDHRDLLAMAPDHRVAAAAYALANDFAHEAPCLLLPGLSDAPGQDVVARLLVNLAQGVANHERSIGLVLAGLATPEAPAPENGLERLAEMVAARGVSRTRVQCRAFQARDGSPLEQRLRVSRVARACAAELAALAPEFGWEVTSPDLLTRACANALRRAGRRGLSPAATLDGNGLRRLALALAPAVLPGGVRAAQTST